MFAHSASSFNAMSRELKVRKVITACSSLHRSFKLYPANDTDAKHILIPTVF
jgi:hypothetical protein